MAAALASIACLLPLLSFFFLLALLLLADQAGLNSSSAATVSQPIYTQFWSYMFHRQFFFSNPDIFFPTNRNMHSGILKLALVEVQGKG
jgi:hypothetical protein